MLQLILQTTHDVLGALGTFFKMIRNTMALFGMLCFIQLYQGSTIFAAGSRTTLDALGNLFICYLILHSIYSIARASVFLGVKDERTWRGFFNLLIKEFLYQN